jgi:hypothetical protein
MTDHELELYFRDMNELFRTSGWKALVEDLKLSIPNLNSVEAAKDEKDLYFRKGQLNIIGTFLNLEETTRIGQEESQRTEDPIEADYADV